MYSPRALALYVLALSELALGSCASPVVPMQQLVLATQHFSGDKVFDVDELVIRAGATIRIDPGVFVFIRTRSLRVEGDATIDASGTPGDDRTTWTSSGDGCWAAHSRWLDSAPDAVIDRGDPGSSAGAIELRYTVLDETSLTTDHLTIRVDGGPGGRGRRFQCGCLAGVHPTHVKYGPSGSDGAAGYAQVIRE